MKAEHLCNQSRAVDGSVEPIVDRLEPQLIEMYARDLTGHRAVDELAARLATLEGVQQVTLGPAGRPIYITCDSALTDADVLVRHARTAGYGICIVTTRFDLHEIRARVCLGLITAALQRTRGVLTTTVDRLTKLVTVSYMPGPTDTVRLRDVITKLAHAHVRTIRQRRRKHHQRSAFRPLHH